MDVGSTPIFIAGGVQSSDNALMGLPRLVKRYTSEEYYSLERSAQYKSEFYDGEILGMSGGTLRHSLISANIIVALGSRLRGGDCRPHESNTRLKVKATGLITYPDVSVFCGPFEYAEDDSARETATNPSVLFEVLSRSTERFDRTIKATSYQQIDSLQAYVLVSQKTPRVEIFERQANGSWTQNEIDGIDSLLALRCLGIDVPFAEIYDRVDFSEFRPDAA